MGEKSERYQIECTGFVVEVWSEFEELNIRRECDWLTFNGYYQLSRVKEGEGV